MTMNALLARVRSASSRTKLAAALLASVGIALATGGFLLTRDTRVALFAHPLASDQLSDVEMQLASWNIAYSASGDGVRIDGAKRADLLLRLSLAGLPRPHLRGSDEVLAHIGALTPQAVLEAQTRDGLAADLALGLRGLEGVADARVIVAAARGGEYADETMHDASASVRITLAPGAHLEARTIAGIKAFVAGGVPGLDPEHVAVLDDRGLVLDGAAASDEGVQVALQSALDAAFGNGVTIVRVHRESRAEERDVHDVRRTPLAGALVRTSNDERYASDKKRYSKAQTSEDRGSDTHDERRVALPGSTARLTVAVFVDAAKVVDLRKIRALAAATTGIDSARGDMLSVEAVPFAAAARRRVPSEPLWAAIGALSGGLPQALVALALITVGWIGAKPAYALANRALETASMRITARDVAGIPAARVRGVLVGEPPHIAAAIISALPTATAAAVLELYPAEERSAIVQRLARAASPLVPAPEDLVRVRG